MKVVLTNDDGYAAPGIQALADEFASRGDKVAIVAPERQRSAASHAVTLHKPLRVKRVPELEKENIEVYHTSGTPSDSAMMGLLEIMPDADILVSGINNGPNLGEDVLYSGTVAGAMEGALIGVRSISVSMAEYDIDGYALAAKFSVGLAHRLAASGLPKRTVLNVNVPYADVADYKGFRVVRLGTRKYEDVLQKRSDPRGQTYFWITGRLTRAESDGDTDNAAVSEGFISVTPLLLDFTHYAMLDQCSFPDPMKD